MNCAFSLTHGMQSKDRPHFPILSKPGPYLVPVLLLSDKAVVVASEVRLPTPGLRFAFLLFKLIFLIWQQIHEEDQIRIYEEISKPRSGTRLVHREKLPNRGIGGSWRTKAPPHVAVLASLALLSSYESSVLKFLFILFPSSPYRKNGQS